MKKALLFIIINLVWSVHANNCYQANELYAGDSTQKILTLEQSMRYKELIQHIDSMSVKDAFAFQSLVKAQLSLGLLSDAYSTMDSAINALGEDIVLLDKFADIALATGDKKRALTYLNKATNISRLPLMMSKKAEILYSLKQYDESLVVIDSILATAPVSSVIRLKSRNLAAKKNIPEAITVLEEQYNSDSNDYITFKQLANLYLAVDSLTALIKITNSHLQKDSDNVEIGLLNAKANYLNNNYSKAVEGYEKLETLGKINKYDDAFFAAMSFYRAEDTLAYKAYEYMLLADSLSENERYPLKYYLASIAAKTGKPDVAETHYNQALQLILPDTIQLAIVLNDLGKVQMINRKPLDAIKNHSEALKYKPNDVTAIISLGLAYLYLDNYEQALPYFEEIIELLPDTVNNVYSNMAQKRIKMIHARLKHKTK